MRICANCKKEINICGKIGRQDLCPHCGSYLHSCINCRFYKPESYHHCTETQAEYVRDEKIQNFCEYFGFKEGARAFLSDEEKKKAIDELNKLFGGA